MIKDDFNNTERYSKFFEGTHYGRTSDERERAASKRFSLRVDEIERAKESQVKWLIAIYVFAAVSSFVPTLGLIAVCLMNIAAYNYGKFHFMRDAERLAYKDAVEKLDKSK